ncbi:MAG: hypothetical protein Q7R73_01445 [bacterium]|nr:hypothetical protein [bacterium]
MKYEAQRGIIKKMGKREKLFLIFLLSGSVFAGSLLFFGNVYALTQPVYTIDVDPPVIFRGDTVFINVTPINFDASTAVFEWYKNGVLDSANSGVGKGTYSLTASASETLGLTTITMRLVVKPGGEFADAQQTLPLSVVTLPEGGVPGAGGAPGTTPGGGIPGIETRSIELLALPSNNPDPGEVITVSVRSSDIDLDRSSFRWVVNGVAPRDTQGIGAKSHTFTAGKTGTNYSISVTVTPPTGTALSKTTAVRSFDMPLYWWADSTTPSWYRGKALPSIGSDVHITALPNLPGVNPRTLLYTWRFNDNYIGAQSGVGKNVFRFTPQFLGVRETIAVRVQNTSGSIDKEKNIEIPSLEPFVRVYELKPLEGVDFIRALTLRAARGGETIDLIAEPFFFPLRNVADLSFRWNLNGDAIPSTAERPRILTIRSAADTLRRHTISVLVENKKDDIQKTQRSVDIEFR